MGKSLTKAEEGIWGMAAHMSALTGLIFPLGLILGPLAIWLLKRNDNDFVGNNAKEALNFQIPILIATFVSVMLSAMSGIFVILAVIIGLVGIGFAIYGGLQAKKGDSYNYPFSLRLIK